MERHILMNYLHDYHAGGVADVFKHIVLLALINALKKKESPFCYIDTHAGGGIYDLTSASAQKTGEYQTGIAKIINQSLNNALLNQYVALVKKCNSTLIKEENKLIYYPGSPFIARRELRNQDRMIIMDYKKEVYDQLKTIFAHDKQIQIHHYDGYLGLKAFLPPKEKRGVVLIDPPFEDINEFKTLTQHLTVALQKWTNGIFVIWYPIKNRKQIEQFHQQIKKLSVANILVTEFCPWPDDVATRLNGSGMIIINPPWQIDLILGDALIELLRFLKQDKNACTKTVWIKSSE